jgi:homoserine O-acetyltransferase
MKTVSEKISFKHSLTLQSGEVLSDFELMTETYGELNSDKSNAVLVCHAFSGNHHAAGIKDEEKSLVGGMKSLEMAKQLIQKNILLSL